MLFRSAAAGSLLITEAGGMVGNFSAEGDYLFSEQIVAGTPKVFSGLIALLHRHAVAAEAATQGAAASETVASGTTGADEARRDPSQRAVRPTRKITKASASRAE